MAVKKSKDYLFKINNISLKSHKVWYVKDNQEYEYNFAIRGFKLPHKGLILFTGQSGCGKSTLINILGLMDKYDNIDNNEEGGIIFCPEDKEIQYNELYKNQSELEKVRRKYFGFMFQHDHLIDSWQVWENVFLPPWLKNNNSYNRNEAIEKVENLLKQLNFEKPGEILFQYPSRLSGGQRQRIALARTLISDPRVIIADEPLASVDSKTGETIIDAMFKQAIEKCVILIVHDLHYKQICNKYLQSKINSNSFKFCNANILKCVLLANDYSELVNNSKKKSN
ncbi:ABC transporter ATP-binding protein [Candidatus Magnetomoraceae bacterium gMMP-15]